MCRTQAQMGWGLILDKEFSSHAFSLSLCQSYVQYLLLASNSFYYYAPGPCFKPYKPALVYKLANKKIVSDL